MHREDMAFARSEIDKHIRKTPYGDGLALPWCLLRDALDEIDKLTKEKGDGWSDEQYSGS